MYQKTKLLKIIIILNDFNTNSIKFQIESKLFKLHQLLKIQWDLKKFIILTLLKIEEF